MDITIKFFGLLTEAIKQEQIILTLKENCTAQDLTNTLLRTFPALEGKEFKLAVNKNIVTENVVILPTDELALLPPFAGG